MEPFVQKQYDEYQANYVEQDVLSKDELRDLIIKDLSYVSKMGVEASDEEVVLHRRLFTEDFDQNIDFLHRAEKWLSKLSNDSSGQQVISPETLKSKIGEVFYLLCTTLAPKLRKDVKRIFTTSPLNTQVEGRRLKSLKLFFKQTF